MKTEMLDYKLPEELIAQHPGDKRDRSRLLVYDRKIGSLADRVFEDIIEYLHETDCLVVNDTRVMPARFYGKVATGAKIEGLFLEQREDGAWKVMLKNSRKVKPGKSISIFDRSGEVFTDAKALEKTPDGTWTISPNTELPIEQTLEKVGFAPLPPYIKRTAGQKDFDKDLQRYQTVFAQRYGAVAAPTAGLHFTPDLMRKITKKGISIARVTLHVGPGTFKPVTVEELEAHEMHSERYSLDANTADTINAAVKTGGRVIAVGTTSVRTLETCARQGGVAPGTGSTDIFITPGYKFKAVNAMITNFHLPRSTLLALVGAFAGLDNTLRAYSHAIERRYRFYSYGDAMFIC